MFTVFGIFLVLCITLLPFNFQASQFSPTAFFQEFLSFSGGVYDTTANIFLFVPFGMGLTGFLSQKRLTNPTKLKLVLVASFGLSLAVEILQIFLPERNPCFIDILTNTTGGGLGFWLFYQQQSEFFQQVLRLVKKQQQHLTLKKLGVAYVGYTSLIICGSVVLLSAAQLTNWDPAFPLAIGNEATGDRPWRGQISSVYIANRAISTPEVETLFAGENPSITLSNSLLAAYQLNGEGNYRDQTGKLPDLIWKGTPPQTPAQLSVPLSPSHWLATKTPVAPLTQKIRQTSQFTLITTIATADTSQKGPARIISVSTDPNHRNFTLGQNESQLVFRLRTPLSGDNGTDPEMGFPNVFTDTKPHRLIILYSASIFRVYVDDMQHSFVRKLTPEANLSHLLLALDTGKIHFGGFSEIVLKLMYYGVLFTPLGILLGMIASKIRRRFTSHLLILYGGIGLPAVLLEKIVAVTNGTLMSPENLLFSVVILTSSMVIIKDQVVPRFKTVR
ncbi:MAG: VanZ family protein [Leptolyngbyaceae cyanobacterium RU_5_1]|nr:VanZ family protein [Leptolyngbyaceae cyanobacterium RU_5_1]